MAQWIWTTAPATADSYAQFLQPFAYSEGQVSLHISADSDYTLWVNGQFVSSNQYRDFPYYKIYDKIDITPFLHSGENLLAVEVWYYGDGNASYYPGQAGLWYEVWQDQTLIHTSGQDTLSRLSPDYVGGKKQSITPQLGYAFHYDATKADSWQNGEGKGFHESVLVEGISTPLPRPVPKLDMCERVPSTEVKSSQNSRIFDLGCEEVGFLTLSLKTAHPQTLTVSWGEHLSDGHVRSVILDRRFFVYLTVGAGQTIYTNYFRRFGARYLELYFEEQVEIDYISLLPCPYPLTKTEQKLKNPLRQRIYDTAVRTLELCLHDHYEDCPWREQAMYAMDGRNQMLCGYYAFSEYTAPRAALYLMSQDNRKDGLLSICTPDKNDLTIPSFSLHYFTAVYEYTVHSQDKSLAEQVYPKLRSILSAFLSHMEEGILPTFLGQNHWNFYEWTDGLAGNLGQAQEKGYDAALNCLFSIALEKMQNIATILGKDDDFSPLKEALNRKIKEHFYVPKTGLFKNSKEGEQYSELVCALAILCGATTPDMIQHIAHTLTTPHEMTKVSLSMCCFVYDALLVADKAQYTPYILADIDRKYKAMLDQGATSFWETEEGEQAFDNAGSLCHGWSAMPVYYYHLLGECHT